MNNYPVHFHFLKSEKYRDMRFSIKMNRLVQRTIMCLAIFITAPAYSADKPAFASDLLINQCLECHSKDSVNTINTYPILQGQKEGYLAEQLHKFRNGLRKDPVMSVQANNLSDADIKAISGYFSKQEFTRKSQKNTNELGMNVRARCISCHGLSGYTVNDEWPNLQGQNSSYILNQLQAFSSGKRDSIIMHQIATELTKEQMKAVANYYQQQGRDK